MKLRQVALVARNLAPVREDLFTLLGIEQDFADEGVAEFGLINSVMVAGETFLEVVSPSREGTTAGRLLTRRGGDGGYMVLLQVEDFPAMEAHLDDLGVRKIWQVSRDQVKACHIHPRDIGAAIVSFDEMVPESGWLWAGPGWRERKAGYVGNIIACDLQSGDPDRLAARWAEVLGRSITTADGRQTIVLDDGSRLNFVQEVDGRGEGVAGVEFEVLDAAAIRKAAGVLHLVWHGNEVSLCGVRLRFRFGDED